MSRHSRTKMWRFAKPWLPTVGMLAVSVLLGWGFLWLVSLDPSSMLPALPLLLGIGAFAGTVFFGIESVKETVVVRMFYPSARSRVKSEIKALRKDRARYVRYAYSERDDPSNSYLRHIEKVDIKIGELTGKGYDKPDYSPTSQSRG